MTTIITRYFASHESAEAAAGKLKADEFMAKDIDVMTSGDAASIRKAGVYERAAKIYADRLGQGGALLVLRAPFGSATRATRLLNGLDAIDVGVNHKDVYIGSPDTRPYYKNKALPELMNSNTLIFSDGLFPRPLLKLKNPIFALFPSLSGSKGPSAKLISGSTTPFSSMLGLPLLTKRRA